MTQNGGSTECPLSIRIFQDFTQKLTCNVQVTGRGTKLWPEAGILESAVSSLSEVRGIALENLIFDAP